MGRKPKAAVEAKQTAVGGTTGRKRRAPKVAEEQKIVVEQVSKTSEAAVCTTPAGNERNEHSQSVPFTSKKEKSKAINVLVRRSIRLQNSQSSGKMQEKKDVHIVDLTYCGGEMELHAEPLGSKPNRNVVSSELTRGKLPIATETTQTINYKTLYMGSQKKIEALTEENCKQAIELSYMRGKVDAYEYLLGYMKNDVAFPDMNLANVTASDAPPNAVTEPELSPGNRKHYVRRLKKNKS